MILLLVLLILVAARIFCDFVVGLVDLGCSANCANMFLLLLLVWLQCAYFLFSLSVWLQRAHIYFLLLIWMIWVAVHTFLILLLIWVAVRAICLFIIDFVDLGCNARIL